MSAQSLKMLKGVGSFVVSHTELVPDTALTDPPYPTSAGTIDFASRSTAEQEMLYPSNHATTPQNTGSTTVAFLYSTWTESI